MNKELSLREIQVSALQVLKSLDSICKELELDYFVMYGTLIGAVRHGGFIPWDDDIDIMMPRKDYNILLEYLNEQRNYIEPFQIFSYKYDESYPYLISRLSDSRYRIEVDNEKDYGIGTFVDIYPLDELSNNYYIACLKGRFYGWLSSLYFLSTREFFPKGDKSLKMGVKYLAYLSSKIIGKKLLKRVLVVNVEGKGDSLYWGCRQWMTDNYKGNIFRSEALKGRSLLQFEDMKVSVPEHYKELLTGFYGDFMELPEQSKRKPHHLYKAYRK